MREDIGIADIFVFIPEERLKLEESASYASLPASLILEKVGVKEQPILPLDKKVIDMALAAVNGLLQQNRLNPKTVDFILYCSCGIQEQMLWSPAAKIQKEIGATQAFSFDINNGCNAGNLGVHVASQMLKADPSKTTALVVIADALSRIVDRKNPDHLCIYNFSDAAAAILIQKGALKNTLLSFAAQTVADFADHMSITPPTPLVTFNTSEKEDEKLTAAYAEMYPAMIEKALDKAGLSVHQMTRLFMNQGDHRLIPKLAKRLQIPIDKIFCSFESYGHLGGSDIFFGLSTMERAGKIGRGDILVLASSAIGFSWSATVLRA